MKYTGRHGKNFAAHGARPGGFSYSSPYTYRDVLKLERQANGTWAWSALPDFPHPIDAFSSVAAVGTTLYVVGISSGRSRHDPGPPATPACLFRMENHE
jgi:hypothetical protein